MKVENGIPLPPAWGRGKSVSWSFVAKMKVGQSFLADDRSQTRVAAKLQYWAEKLGWKFTTRKVDEGVRVWRVA
jgi:hypothetical protein